MQQRRQQKIDTAVKNVSQFLTGGARDFFITQIRLSSRSRKGYRWSDDEKAFSLTLYHASPKCYKLLASTFALPSTRTLRKCMQDINIGTGFHDAILEGLKIRAKSMSDQDNLCAVVFDEMSIKERLVYNAQSDIIEKKKLLTTILECNAGNGLLCGRDDCVEYFSFRL